MPESGVSRANKNRAIRQDALREQLANKGLLQQVLENAAKIQDLNNDLGPAEVQRLKTASELQLKLVNKYLPDVKAVEITGEAGEPIESNVDVYFVSAEAQD